MNSLRLRGHLFIWMLLIISSSVQAQTAAKSQDSTSFNLTLEESIERAQESNLMIQSLQERVKTAETQATAARAKLLPNLSVNGNYTYFKDLSKSVLEFSGDGFPPTQSGDGTEPSGGNGSASSVTELVFGAHHNFQATLSLKQPVFAWGRYVNTYRAAKLDLEAAQKQLEATSHQLSLDVSEAFHGVLLASEFVDVTRQTVDLVDKQLDIAQKRFTAGAATNFDVLRAEVQLANSRSQLIQAKNRVAIAENAFKNLLNIDLVEEIALTGSFDLPAGLDLNLESLISTAKENRPEIQQLEFSEAAGQKRVAVAKTGNRPDLSVFSNYQLDDNEKLTKMNRVWNVGVQINIPIFDGFATLAAVQQAKSGLKQAQLAKHQRMDTVEFEVRTAHLNLIQAKALINVQKETVAQAQESVRFANLRYENGMLTSVELTDAQLALAQAQVNHLQATHDYVVEFARLEQAVGQKLR